MKLRPWEQSRELTIANDSVELSLLMGTTSCAAQKAPESQVPLTHEPYLVAAQGCKDESILTHNAVWKLFLSILILSCPQGERELGELGLVELSKKNYLLLVSRRREETGLPPTGPLTVTIMRSSLDITSIGLHLLQMIPGALSGRTHTGSWSMAGPKLGRG